MTATDMQLLVFRTELENELTSNILPFWMKQMRDLDGGGYFGRCLSTGQVVKDAPRGAVLNARILWTFSAAFQAAGKDEYLDQARITYEWFTQNFIDEDHGGIYWSVDSNGNALNTRKQVYAQAFAIYALSEYFKASQDTAAIMHAIDLYNLIEKHAFDQQTNGYIEALDREWLPLEDLRLSEKDANEPKSMNTHLHLLEAYTNLYEVWKDLELEVQLTNLIRIHFDKILDKETSHFNLFFNMSWEPRSTAYSFGHDIEGAWLIRRAAQVLENHSLIQESGEKAFLMAQVTRNEGIATDGSLLNEGHLGKVTDTDRHWWPQAEAVIGFLDAYEWSKETPFFDASREAWQFVDEKMRHPSGEWWWLVDGSYNPDQDMDLAGEWKCPYHNARMCIEVMKRCSSLLKNKMQTKDMQNS